MTVQTLNLGGIPAESTPAPEGHDAKMAEVFDNAQAAGQPQSAPEPQKPSRPDNVPEKFWDAEKGEVRWDDLAKAYSELEGKLGGQKQQQQNQQQEAPATVEQASEQLQNVGLDFDEFAAEVYANGQLGEDSYAKLEKAGIPRTMVDAFIEGQKAVAETKRNEVLNTVGGEERYSEMVQWAVENLNPAQIEAYNRAVDSADMETVRFAVEGLKARYESAVGSEPNLIHGGTNSQSGEVFRSTAELTNAMRDPRYKIDPAYRADVEAKLARSNIF